MVLSIHAKQASLLALLQLLAACGKLSLSPSAFSPAHSQEDAGQNHRAQKSGEVLGPINLDSYKRADAKDGRFLSPPLRSAQLTDSRVPDAQAPRLDLLELSISAAGDLRTLRWSVGDHCTVRSERSLIYACIRGTPLYLLKSYDELSKLPSSCAVVLRGDELRADGEQIILAATIIDEREYQPIQLLHYLYAEDLSGIGAAVPMSPGTQQGQGLAEDAQNSPTQKSRNDCLEKL